MERVFFMRTPEFKPLKGLPEPVIRQTCRDKFLSHLGQVWGCASHKPELLTTSLTVSVGNVPPLGTKWYLLPLIAFKKILVSTLNNRSVVLNFGIFQGMFGHFYALIEISMHLCSQFKLELQARALMHINWSKIQICVLDCMLRSHTRNGNGCQTPCHHHSSANIEIPDF